MAKQSWFAVGSDLRGSRALILTAISFLLPLGLWCLVSYHPTLWKPKVLIEVPSGDFGVGQRMELDQFPSAISDARARIERIQSEHTDGVHRDLKTDREMSGRQIGRANNFTVLRMAQLAVARGWMAEEDINDPGLAQELIIGLVSPTRAADFASFSADNQALIAANAKLITEARANDQLDRKGLPTNALLLT